MVKEKITKEFIIDYLQTYYEKNNKIPLSRDKEHPFSAKTVSNKLGSWGEALTIAKIPLSRNNPVEVKCRNEAAIRIQKACYNWIWKPETRDGKLVGFFERIKNKWLRRFFI